MKDSTPSTNQPDNDAASNTAASNTAAALITIRAVEPDDYPFLQEIYSQRQAIWGTLQQPYTPAAEWRKRLAEPRTNARQLLACIDDQPVGNLGLFIQPAIRQRHIGEIGMGVDDRWQGRGVGHALMREALTLADQWLNLHRLQLTVYVDNEPALRLYRAHGFEIEGTLADYAYRDGAYVDAYAMARLRNREPSSAKAVSTETD